MTRDIIQNPAYRIGVIYGRDTETTIINLKIMTPDRAVIGYESATPSDDIDLFIHLVRQAIAGVDFTGTLNDGSLLSIYRRGDCIIFDAPEDPRRKMATFMKVVKATAMADELDAVQDAINTFLNAGVVLLAA